MRLCTLHTVTDACCRHKNITIYQLHCKYLCSTFLIRSLILYIFLMLKTRSTAHFCFIFINGLGKKKKKSNKCGNLQEISTGLHLFASWDLQIYRLSTEKIKIRCYSVSFGIIHASRKEKEKLCVYTTANFSIAYEKLKFITITKKKHVANTAPKKSCYT